MGQQKPTFPAYSNISNATISAPPTTNLGNASSTGSTSSSDSQKPPQIPQNTGTASKIMHPPEDISLEEIRARKPQYRLNRASSSSAATATSSASIATSVASSLTADVVAAINKANESKMVAAAQEVSQQKNFHPFFPHYYFLIYFEYFFLFHIIHLLYIRKFAWCSIDVCMLLKFNILLLFTFFNQLCKFSKIHFCTFKNFISIKLEYS